MVTYTFRWEYFNGSSVYFNVLTCLLFTDSFFSSPLLFLQIGFFSFFSFFSFSTNCARYRRVIASNEPISLSNELRVVRTLWSASEKFLSEFENRTQEADYEEIIEHQRKREMKPETPMSRQEVAAHVRLSEKRILTELRIWLKNHWLQFVGLPFDELSNLDEFWLQR